jgi:hypothetical protein
MFAWCGANLQDFRQCNGYGFNKPENGVSTFTLAHIENGIAIQSTTLHSLYYTSQVRKHIKYRIDIAKVASARRSKLGTNWVTTVVGSAHQLGCKLGSKLGHPRDAPQQEMRDSARSR